MLRIVGVLLVGFALGAVTAVGALSWPVRPGVVGLAVMAVVAIAARYRVLGLDLAAPGSPERGLWIGLGSGAVLAGHLCTSLSRIGAEMVLHSRESHALGIDSWTLVLGGVLAWAIARDPEPRHDERDAQIAAMGLRWSHFTLVTLLVAGLVPLAFEWTDTIARLTRPMIAHLLIAALVFCWIVDCVVRLREYRRDAQEAAP